MGQNERAARAATQHLAQAIREAQGAANLSATATAERSGIPYSTYRKVREAKTAIDYEQMTALARAFGIRVSDLTGRAEELGKQ